MVTFLLYQIVYTLIWLLHLPKVGWDAWRSGKYRKSFWLRLTGELPPLKGLRPRVWIHAVSVGEVRAVATLAKRLQGVDLVVSTVTETGLSEAKRQLPEALAHLYLPFDFYPVMKRMMSTVSPTQVILSEGDHWPAFQKAAVEVGAVVSSVSAKISERSAKRLQKFPWVAQLLYRDVALICAQNGLYADRFRTIGLSPERIHVCGNIKFDAEVTRVNDLAGWRAKLGIREGEKVLVLGSTHHPEEERLLTELKKLSDWKILLVPRHPERFDQVAALLNLRKESWFRLSEGGEGRVVLVDRMGLLRDCYEVADVAIVAGSFVPHVGGHNLLEPADYGVPVIFGPHTDAQEEMRDLILTAQAGRQVTVDEVVEAIEGIDPAMGERGRELVSSLRGAVDRTLSILSR